MGNVDQLLAEELDNRIREKVMVRRWYRQHRWESFKDLEAENLVALRTLLQLRSFSRRVERRISEAHARWNRHASHEYFVSECDLCVRDRVEMGMAVGR